MLYRWFRIIYSTTINNYVVVESWVAIANCLSQQEAIQLINAILDNKR